MEGSVKGGRCGRRAMWKEGDEEGGRKLEGGRRK